VTYQWSGPGGFSASGSSTVVGVAGTYTVTVTASNGCSSSANAVVSNDVSLPQATIEATNPVLTCAQVNTTLNATASTAIDSYSWSGPGGFIGADEDITIGNPGTYVLTLTGDNGCVNSVQITINEDVTAPNASASGGTLNCTVSQVNLMGTSTTSGVSYMWSGPNGFSSVFQNPVATEAGTYTLTVTASNGCSATATAQVNSASDLPQITATGGTIDCASGTAQLQGSSTTAGVTYSWTGPGAFTSTSTSPTVSSAGTYILTVTAGNGCQSQQSVQVLNDTNAPSNQPDFQVLDCLAQTIGLTFTSDDPAATISWSGPGGFSSTAASPSISSQGLYTLTLTSSNGCSSTQTIDVVADFDYTADITTIDATGSTGGEASINITGGTGPFTIEWDTGTIGNSASDLSVGTHTVIITDGLGCTEIIDFEINLVNSVIELSELLNLSLYPNPAEDVLNLKLSQKDVSVNRIQILDLGGRVLWAKQWGKGQSQEAIPVYDLSDGTYLVRLYTDRESITHRFVKR
jgi:hypothetical protein